MSILKKLFPFSFTATEKDTLVRSILLYAAVAVGYFLVGAVLGFLLGRVAAWLLGLIGTVVGLYATGGIVLSILRYCGIIQ